MEERRILFEGIDTPDIDRWPVYGEHGGGEGLRRAQSLPPATVIDEVGAAGLRGRGGAWRPVGERWRLAASGGGAGYLIVDLLESEPGRFRDRKLAERTPHRILEGARIAAHAVGAHTVYICIAAAALRARQALAQALEETRIEPVAVHLHPVSGRLPVASGDSLPVALVQGGRAEPRADDGNPSLPRLFDGTAVVHTASTLGYLPALLATGGDVFGNEGSRWAPGTQAFCVSGLVRRPGLYEVELGGGTVRDLVEDLAGGARDGQSIKFVLHAGYGSAPALLEEDLDRPLDPGCWSDPAGGKNPGVFGGGVVLVADDSVCAVDTARRMARTFADSACGKCLPCREGTQWLAATLDRLEEGAAILQDLELITRCCTTLTPDLALCGHGPAAARGIQSLLTAFTDEFEAHLEGGCPVAKDSSMKVPDSIHVRY
ncbi:MAG TPA: NADH-ubiquinone oxidoreductase-F iron-sulfur binding region domain-containing protein [Candidatus Latescibacteria bacterium]|jgi:NADH-quinone oxidoreductase subunit F|nr:hypothetical protein [Gemmatimonadaceae bacterium]MDP6017512.1 NADH-ubiquinone oxidoreductase-F iron-sulfur binding region domain-containing protein [Candidatus Latescibacterota bacterium]HJP32054.1 NADH-ubiquinone oxidoreductase-F iron-sulfur binding region domain-containing protein [Candidatus Latescibacterota bacterium]